MCACTRSVEVSTVNSEYFKLSKFLITLGWVIVISDFSRTWNCIHNFIDVLFVKVITHAHTHTHTYTHTHQDDFNYFCQAAANAVKFIKIQILCIQQLCKMMVYDSLQQTI